MKKELFDLIFSKKLDIVLLLTILTIGLITFNEYGISWDEPTQRETGIVNIEYILSVNQNLLNYQNQDYGVAFILPLNIIEIIFNITDSRDIYLMRHLITHLFFLISALFFFRLIDLLYRNKILATIGFLLLVLHPHIYAHSFFNCKDIPFMSMFIICLYYNAIAFRKKTIINFIILGITVGLLINIRIMGIMLPCCTLFFLIIDSIKEKNYSHHLKLGLLFIFTAAIVLYITWPFLWTNPIKHFGIVFQNMSKFRWYGLSLFNGTFIKPTNIPWYYIPVWFSITTPLFYLITGLTGIVMLIIHLLKKPSAYINNSYERNNLFYLIFCFCPVIIVIMFKSVVYDSWRHLYFIYPSFVMLAVYGFNILYQNNKIRRFFILAFIPFIFIILSLVRNYPFQHVYFNDFLSFSPPEYIRKNFDLEYWGTSYRQSLEYILKNDNSPSINISVENSPGKSNIYILPSDQRKRINFVPIGEATYFITNYRCHPQDYKKFEKLRFYSIIVENNTINEVFKLK